MESGSEIEQTEAVKDVSQQRYWEKKCDKYVGQWKKEGWVPRTGPYSRATLLALKSLVEGEPQRQAQKRPTGKKPLSAKEIDKLKPSLGRGKLFVWGFLSTRWPEKKGRGKE